MYNYTQNERKVASCLKDIPPVAIRADIMMMTVRVAAIPTRSTAVRRRAHVRLRARARRRDAARHRAGAGADAGPIR